MASNKDYSSSSEVESERSIDSVSTESIDLTGDELEDRELEVGGELVKGYQFEPCYRPNLTTRLPPSLTHCFHT